MSRFDRAPRLTGIVVAGSILVLLELGLRLAGAGDYRDRPDPFGGFAGLPTVFERRATADGPDRYVARKEPGKTRSFAADKPADGFRVFVLGGSSEAGTPYGYDYSFAEFLRELLADSLPGRHVEVINAAAPGFASRRVLYVAREVAAYSPDLLIVCTGHNELVEQRLYAHLYAWPDWLLDLHQALRHSRLYVMLEDVYRRLSSPEGVVIDGKEIYAPMFGPLGADHWKDTRRDEERQRHLALMMFQSNVEQIVRVARNAGAQVMLVSQAKNYAGWPAVGEHREALDEAQQARWSAGLETARLREAEGNLTGAIAALRDLLSIDDDFAEVYWRLARLYQARGEYAEAMSLYRRAHNTTFSNFGTTPERNETLERVARDQATLWVDMDRVFERSSPNGLVGFNWFVDFLHPNLAGHELIAETIAAELRKAGVPEPTERWNEPRPLPTVQALHAADSFLRVRELRNRIMAEIVSERREAAMRFIAELRRIYPEDPRLPQLETWATQGLTTGSHGPAETAVAPAP